MFNLPQCKAVEIVEEKKVVKPETIRREILEFEKMLIGMEGFKLGDSMPLKHTFADGVYVREISVPKGTLLVTKIHKIKHPYFLLKGEVSVLTEDGVKRLKAPYSGITPAGTKRVIYIHEDTIWTTIHITNKTDLDEIEKDIIAKSYEEMGLVVDRIEEDNKMLDFINKIINQEEL